MYQVFDWIWGCLLANLQQSLGYLRDHVVNQVLPDRPRFLVEDLGLVLGQLLKVEPLFLKLFIFFSLLLVSLGLRLLNFFRFLLLVAFKSTILLGRFGFES